VIQLMVVRRYGLLMSLLAIALPFQRGSAAIPSPEPFITLLDLHPVEPSMIGAGVDSGGGSMPGIVRPGVSQGPDARQMAMPVVITPAQPDILDPAMGTGKAGTGFFVGGNGTLLTAAHVVTGCGRIQVISKYLRRSWVSLLATDEADDIALLRVIDARPPAVVAVSSSAPVSGKLFVLGYPATASLTVPAETWAVMENQKFPAGVGSLANPRELLWMSAPDVTHGFSGGPIFDPRQGAVVGIIKGQVDGGYLRLVRDMPTTGIAIGPGIAHIGTFLRHETSYTTVASSADEDWETTLRRATVHVLCWH
jgi:S1-C subfamily serine protease